MSHFPRKQARQGKQVAAVGCTGGATWRPSYAPATQQHVLEYRHDVENHPYRYSSTYTRRYLLILESAVLRICNPGGTPWYRVKSKIQPLLPGKTISLHLNSGFNFYYYEAALSMVVARVLSSTGTLDHLKKYFKFLCVF